MRDLVISHIPGLVWACHRNMLPWAMVSVDEPDCVLEVILEGKLLTSSVMLRLTDRSPDSHYLLSFYFTKQGAKKCFTACKFLHIESNDRLLLLISEWTSQLKHVEAWCCAEGGFLWLRQYFLHIFKTVLQCALLMLTYTTQGLRRI